MHRLLGSVCGAIPRHRRHGVGRHLPLHGVVLRARLDGLRHSTHVVGHRRHLAGGDGAVCLPPGHRSRPEALRHVAQREPGQAGRPARRHRAGRSLDDGRAPRHHRRRHARLGDGDGRQRHQVGEDRGRDGPGHRGCHRPPDRLGRAGVDTGPPLRLGRRGPHGDRPDRQGGRTHDGGGRKRQPGLRRRHRNGRLVLRHHRHRRGRGGAVGVRPRLEPPPAQGGARVRPAEPGVSPSRPGHRPERAVRLHVGRRRHRRQCRRHRPRRLLPDHGRRSGGGRLVHVRGHGDRVAASERPHRRGHDLGGPRHRRRLRRQHRPDGSALQPDNRRHQRRLLRLHGKRVRRDSGWVCRSAHVDQHRGYLRDCESRLRDESDDGTGRFPLRHVVPERDDHAGAPGGGNGDAVGRGHGSKRTVRDRGGQRFAVGLGRDLLQRLCRSAIRHRPPRSGPPRRRVSIAAGVEPTPVRARRHLGLSGPRPHHERAGNRASCVLQVHRPVHHPGREQHDPIR